MTSAQVSHDHDCSCAASPAFRYVGTSCFITHSMKIKRRDGLLDVRVDVTRRDLYPKPFRFANYDVLPPKTGNIDIVQKRQLYTQ